MRPPFNKILQTSALMTGAMALVFSSAGVAGATSVDEPIVTEDTDLNDGGTMNNVVDDGDNAHPSGKDRSVENGASGNQGKSSSDPDDDGNGPDRSNGGPDKPGGEGGTDKADQDGNNGCGNDDDFEDDNEGKCLGRDGAPGHNKPETPEPVTPIECDDDQMAVDGDDADEVPDTCVDVEDETDEDETDEDETDEDETDEDETDEDETDEDNEAGAAKIGICHATGNGGYVFIEIAVAGVLNGHVGEDHQDGDDIIPAFGDFPGQNTTATELTEADCVIDDVDTDVPGATGDGDAEDEDEDDDGDGDVVLDEDEDEDEDDVDDGGSTPVPDVDVPIVGGEVVQNPVTPVVPVVRPVVPATPAVPTVSPAVPAQPAVLAAAATNPQVLGAQVTRAPGQLARTGDATTNLVPFGLGLVLLGLGVQRSSKRFAAARVR